MEQFREFVEEVGGVPKVAEVCGVRRDTVYKWWERNRVPHNKTFALKRLADSQGITLTLETLEKWTNEPENGEAA